ncbi:membrane associated ring-CH-type finger 4b [Chanos chanos]|uniref:RING-type E3 ubiquitin transferase n=1 Tax=Chanos chanos TaxID=29144 RepID=A0A6J2WGY8_CHACN|nr:E3 ubiquitin-protein ligase MARCH4-like [Chanos chanos]
MLRCQGMLKSRCYVLFSDLKVFLLRPQSPAPTTALNLMSGQSTERCAVTSYVNSDNSNAARAHRLEHWNALSTEGAVGTEAQREGALWSGTAAELSEALNCRFSSDEFSKDKRDERFSFLSCTDGIRTPVCRICFQGPEQGELLSPCRCSGSVRSTHQHCLIKWISERGSWTCELCYYKYQVIAISTKNPLQWQAISLTVIEKVQIAAAILGSLFLIASISWLVWSSLSPSAKWQRQDLLFQICYGMYGFMDIVCIALIVHEGPSVFRIFNRWQAVNQQWKVLNYDKTKDGEDLNNGEGQWTTSLLNEREQTGEGMSTSSSSLQLAVAAASPTAATATNTNATVTGQSVQDSSTGNGTAVPDQHCAYNILHLLSHLRQQEPRSQAGSHPRELVMRITTV